MLSQLAGKATFVNYLPRLTQATSDDGEPTAGYLLEEITKITFQSVASSHQLVDYLIHRLNKSSTQVKIKVLKIMIYVINNGHLSFRQQLRQHDGSIKNATLHSGPADPMFGNTLYKDVQKLAQDTLDSLFNPETIKEEETDPRALSPIESQPTFMSGMGATAQSNGKYEGFGNAMKEREGTVTDKMLDYLGRLIHPSDDQTSEFIRAALHSSPGDYQPVAVAGALTDPVFTAPLPMPSMASYVKSHVPGRAGGGWESDEDNENEFQNSSGPEAAEILLGDPQTELSLNLQTQNDAVSDDNTFLEIQDVLNKFSQALGVPSIDDLDEVCAKCAAIGLSQTWTALLRMNLSKCTHQDGVMRILLLWEWLYHYDSSTQQALIQNGAQVLDEVMANTAITEASLSKVKKLKLLLRQVVNDSLNTAVPKS
ncbi:AP-4 complex accessory subunit Tepsin-like [Thrips palmi]|uniref:AP-4 complex accessory subunit Tepsin-like n=1 Tax=Thrips palmi TaxID=161013 RepID=A0A6P8Z980_THRPL|nr:AP-4 complex accessory subunit Tepsin-like [Thrips palmi]